MVFNYHPCAMNVFLLVYIYGKSDRWSSLLQSSNFNVHNQARQGYACTIIAKPCNV